MAESSIQSPRPVRKSTSRSSAKVRKNGDKNRSFFAGINTGITEIIMEPRSASSRGLKRRNCIQDVYVNRVVCEGPSPSMSTGNLLQDYIWEPEHVWQQRRLAKSPETNKRTPFHRDVSFRIFDKVINLPIRKQGFLIKTVHTICSETQRARMVFKKYRRETPGSVMGDAERMRAFQPGDEIVEIDDVPCTYMPYSKKVKLMQRHNPEMIKRIKIQRRVDILTKGFIAECTLLVAQEMLLTKNSNMNKAANGKSGSC